MLSLASLTQRTLLAGFSLICLLAGAALAEPDVPDAVPVACANLDECMMKGQQAESIDSAIAYYSKGIGHWKPGDSKDDLSLATLIRAQVYIQYFGQSRDAKHLELAEKDFTRVTELTPASYEGFAGLAVVAANRGKFDETESWFKKGIAADPEDPFSYQERAAFYFARENFPAVVTDIDKAISLLASRTYDEATKSYKITTGADLPPEQRVILHIMRAQAYLKLGKEPQALEDLAAACKLGEKRACQ